MKRFALWLSRYQYYVELPLFALSMILLIFWRNGNLHQSTPLVASLGLLGVFYYLSGRFTPDVAEKYGMISTRIVSLSSMISVVGIILSIMHAPIGRSIAFLGAFCLILTVIFNLYFWTKSNDRNYFPYVIRAAVFAVLAAAVFMQGV